MLTTDEVNGADEEVNFVTAREEFWYQRKLRHPIMYEQQNVCALEIRRAKAALFKNTTAFAVSQYRCL